MTLLLLPWWWSLLGQVDVLILEVGVGGRFDATNVSSRPVACGINTLDLDHTSILGDTIEKIAWEKGGIIKAGRLCFTIPQPKGGVQVLQGNEGRAGNGTAAMTTTGPLRRDVIMTVMATVVIGHADCAREAGAPLVHVEPICLPPGYTLGIEGDHQLTNAALALALALSYTADKRGESPWNAVQPFMVSSSPSPPRVDMSPLLVQDPSMAQGLAACRWPGRCQIIHRPRYPSLWLFLDGAHTDHSIRLATQWFDREHLRRDPSASRCLIFHCNTEKVVVDLLKHLVWDHTSQAPRFEVVCFCPVSLSRPTLAEEVGAEAIISRQSEEEDSLPVAGLLPLLPTARDLAAPQPSCETPLPWQRSLAEVWRVLELYYHRRAKEVKDEGHHDGKTLQSPLRSARITIQHSMEAALHHLNTTGTPGKPFHVLVTGSLYLVGDALSAVSESSEER